MQPSCISLFSTMAVDFGSPQSYKSRGMGVWPMIFTTQETPMPIAVGQEAPDFELDNQDKVKVRLSSFRGKKKVVLAFYPLDWSPVCTNEHMCFATDLPQFDAADAVI